jgi:hypothetical protein
MENEHTRFDIVHGVFKELVSVAETLEQASRSLTDIGLDRLAGTLWCASQDIFESVKTLRDADAAEIHERFQQSQQSSANVLNSVLAGIELGRKEE